MSLFWGACIDRDIARALQLALVQVNEAATKNHRLVTQISHTVTVLGGRQSATKVTFDAIGDEPSRVTTGEYFLVTVTATTISAP